MNKSKFTLLAASIMLALLFIISCSSDDGDEGDKNGSTTSSSSIEGAKLSSSSEISSSEGFTGGLDSQVYQAPDGCDNSSCLEKWNGNGSVVLSVRCYGRVDEDENTIYHDINNVGVITNGKVSFDLPDISEIPEECLGNIEKVFNKELEISPSEVKVAEVHFDVTANGSTCRLSVKGGSSEQGITRGYPFYFTKPVTITGTLISEGDEEIHNINAATGLNIMYKYEICEGSCEATYTTNLESVEVKPVWNISCEE